MRGESPASIGSRFKPGPDSRRGNGSPSAGRSVTLYLNSLCKENDDGTCKYSPNELRRIARDPKSPHARVIAAKELLRCRSDGYDKNGRTPKAADSIDRLHDRTVGKPSIHVEVEDKRPRSLEQVTQDTARLVRMSAVALSNSPKMQMALLVECKESPILAAALKPVFRELLPELADALGEPVIDSTAKALPPSEEDE